MQLTSTQAIDRLTLGATPGLNEEVHRLGVTDWLTGQLTLSDEPAGVISYISGLDVMTLEPGQLFKRYWLPLNQRRDPEVQKRNNNIMRNLYIQTAAARLWRASESPWQLRELLVDFWFNHFNVFVKKGLCALWTGNFENRAIRPHVLGKFSDLLLATASHPAMLFYLDNWLNTRPGGPGKGGVKNGFNENYARELMELHTVGLNYTQDDVIGATHLLTGWGLQRTTGFHFYPGRHDFSSRTILGRRFAGGKTAIIDFLNFLAAHPDTARHVSYRLAQYLAADRPSVDLVKHMQARFLDSNGDLKAVTSAMIEHPDFALAAGRRDKFRTPYRYVLAVLRASGLSPENSRPLIAILQRLGQPLYHCVTPNGWACTQDEWLSPDSLTARLNFAIAIGGGWLPIANPSGKPLLNHGMNSQRGSRPQKRRGNDPVDMETVLSAIGNIIPRNDIAVAKLAPQRLKAAVLLGSPQMQYC